MPLQRAAAGTRPGGRVPFFRVAERKSPKKGRPYCARPFAALRATCDARTEGAPQNSLRADALRSNNCGKSVHEVRVSFGTRTHPLPCASRHAQKGTQRTSIRAIALLGPVCAARGTCASEVGPSEAMARVAVRLSTPLLAAPAAGWLRGGMGVEAPMLRALTRRGCLSGARSAKRVPRRTPQPTRRRFAPSHSEGVADWGSPFFWVLFFGEAKKSTSPAGATPGLRPQPRHAVQSAHKKPTLQNQ